MKYVSILFLLLVFTFPIIAQQATSWQSIYPYPTGVFLNGLHAWNKDSIITVGQNGTIVKTTDSGVHWTVRQNVGSIAAVTYFSVTFPSKTIGYAVGSFGAIIKTTDGGESWIEQTSGTSRTLYGVDFVNDTVGVAVGGTQFFLPGNSDWEKYKDPVVLRTTNGGKTWVNLPFSYYTGLRSVAFRDEANGIAVGDSLNIFRTTDGGNTWNRVSENNSGVNSYKCVRHISGTSYVTVGGGDARRSTDDGLTWELLPYPPYSENPLKQQYSVSFIDTTHGITGGRWYIHTTQNSGNPWTSFYSYGMVIRDVRMIDSLISYVVGDYGTIMKTTDGGVTWIALSGAAKPSSSYYGIYFVNANNGFVAGSNSILHTTDGGNTWNKQSYPLSVDVLFRDIFFTDTRTGYLVGETSVPGNDTVFFLKTTNAGEDWLRLNTPIYAGNQRVFFSDSMHGTVVGDSGNYGTYSWSVIRTTDAGATWTWQNTPLNDSTGWPWGLYFSNNNNGTIVGTASSSNTPAILRTTDGGNTWIRQSCSLERAVLRDVSYTDSLNGMIVGGEYNINNQVVGLILKTTDGGTSWTKISHPLENLEKRYFSRIVSLNENVKFVSSSAGILYTTNGGATWTKQTNPISTFLGMSFVKSGEGWKGYGSYLGIATTTIGELPAKYWMGNVDSSWDTPENWDPVGVPTSGDSVVIRPNGTSPVIFMPKSQVTLAALTIIGAGRLTITDALAQLVVLGDVDIRGTLKIREGAKTRILCGRKWKNKPGRLFASMTETDEGFVPANSTVYFNGQGDFQGNFYNIVFDTSATMETGGNVVVANKCTILKSMSLRSEDTLFISSNDPQALYGSGIIQKGTIERFINQTSGEQYQFESKTSFVQFQNVGTTPEIISMRVFPETTATDWGDVWEVVESVIDTSTNTVVASNVQEFSKWSLGVPRPTNMMPLVNRVYAITEQGGDNFTAQLSLRFLPSELIQGTAKDSLQLLRLLGIYSTSITNEKWNMVSLPVERKTVDLRKKDSLFESSSSDAFAFIPSTGYVQKDTIEYGVGYWLKFPSVDTISILGEKREESKIPVETGWNMIGTLSAPINTSSVTSEPSGIIASDFFGYQSGYLTATILEPMKAYWVKVSSPGVLQLQTSSSIKKEGTENKQVCKFNLLTVRDASGNSQKLYYTTKDKRSLKTLFNEMPPPPPDGVFDVRYKSQRLIEFAYADKPKEVPLVISSAIFPVTIRWEPKEKNILGWLLVDGKEYSLAKKDSITFMKSETSVKVKFASSNDNIPKEFGLEQNYPNPFNPSTAIRYQLPIDSRVTLKIFNVLGQEVATLVDDIQEAGYVTKEWNASGIASGVYFYRLEATSVSDNTKSYHQIKKMLLLR